MNKYLLALYTLKTLVIVAPVIQWLDFIQNFLIP